MDPVGDADSLMREMEASMKAFDKWAADQLAVIRTLSQEEKERRMAFESAMQKLTAEQKQIQQRTSQAKRDSQRLAQQGKLRADEHSRLQLELSTIPKEIKYLEHLHYVLQVRRDRLTRSGQATDTQIVHELRAFESLYGFSVSSNQKRITFTFTCTNVQVILKEDEGGKFRIIRAPLSVNKIQSTAIARLNAKRELLPFLVSVRRCLT
jgi:predicted nuclease with TOPRIM domain